MKEEEESERERERQRERERRQHERQEIEEISHRLEIIIILKLQSKQLGVILKKYIYFY